VDRPPGGEEIVVHESAGAMMKVELLSCVIKASCMVS
jgi:hypothetical protein